MSITSTFPYTNTIVTTVGNYPVPLFPGAYIIRRTTTGPTNGLVPIYQSISDFSIASSNNGITEILQDKDALVIVLPGFTLNLYVDWNYLGTVYSYDNSGGTDVKYSISNPANLATSCRLFYKFPSGNVEVGPFILNVTFDATATVTYNSVTYRLFEFWTGGSKTFYIANGTTTNTSPLPIQALLIGGGGGGGSYVVNGNNGSGGGGAGTFITTSFNAMPGDIFTVTVGAGGAAATNNTTNMGGVGSPTSITRTVGVVVDASLNAGGGGGGGGAGTNQTAGNIGTTIYGSTGGGCAAAATASSTLVNVAYTVTSGSTLFTGITVSTNRGGSGAGSLTGGGGGGGAGAAGGAASGGNAGAGGAGLAWTINGTTYAGGGGGVYRVGTGSVNGAGGTGGGGTYGGAGTANTGSGGGGGYSTQSGGAGGSGICIIAIPFNLLA